MSKFYFTNASHDGVITESTRGLSTDAPRKMQGNASLSMEVADILKLADALSTRINAQRLMESANNKISELEND